MSNTREDGGEERKIQPYKEERDLKKERWAKQTTRDNSRSGSVCLDVINQTWSPMFDMINIFEVFLPQLLRYPNPTDPLNGEAAALLMREPKGYEAKVKGTLLSRAAAVLHLISRGPINRDFACHRIRFEIRQQRCSRRRRRGERGRGRHVLCSQLRRR